MKPKTIFSLILFFCILSSNNAQNLKPAFTGEWKLNREKTVLTDNQLFLSKLTIQLKNDSLLTTRTYENGNGEEYPFLENLSLDGKESKIYIYEMPRTSKALKPDTNGTIVIESTTVFQGNNGAENLTAKESWKVENDGQSLAINFINKMAGVETTGTNYYNKVK